MIRAKSQQYWAVWWLIWCPCGLQASAFPSKSLVGTLRSPARWGIAWLCAAWSLAGSFAFGRKWKQSRCIRAFVVGRFGSKPGWPRRFASCAPRNVLGIAKPTSHGSNLDPLWGGPSLSRQGWWYCFFVGPSRAMRRSLYGPLLEQPQAHTPLSPQAARPLPLEMTCLGKQQTCTFTCMCAEALVFGSMQKKLKAFEMVF